MDEVRALVVGEVAEWRERILAALATTPLSTEPLASGRAALEKLDVGVALLVVAAHTSDLSGIALCRLVREQPGGESIAVVLVSARSDEMERVLAFENGADDFVPEPFSRRELAARVNGILRRRGLRASPRARPEIEVGPLHIDLVAEVVELDGRRVRLTLREFEVLKQLALSGGRVVRRAELLRALDGDVQASERIVDTHVKSIRGKLGRARGAIETVRGVGYRFDGNALGEG